MSLTFVLLSISWLNAYNGYDLFPKMDALSFGISFFLIVIGAIKLEVSDSIGQVKQFFIYIGNASYSIYLIHFVSIIVFTFMLKKIVSNSLVLFIIVSLVTLLISLLSYSFIEVPITKRLNMKNDFSKVQ
jgi:peptidoglycan/LPS O-acetylase OafA/YrhL